MSDSNGLPKGWTRISIGDLGDWHGGSTPSKSNEAFWVDGTVPWVSPKDMKSFRITDSEDHISDAALQRTNISQFSPGTVLFVVRSGILSRTLPVAVSEVAATMNQDLKGVSPHKGINPLYVAYCTISHERDMLARCSKHGTTVASIDTHALQAYQFPLAPSNEQNRIVAKIEELFSDLDAGVKALERVKANLKRYRAAVLKAAVEGKLTEEWRAEHPDTEPASELLERILIERRQRWEEEQLAKYEAKGKKPPKGWKSRYKEPVAPDDSKLARLPDSWCWASWEQLINEGDGFKRGPFGSTLKKEIFVEHGYKVYEQYCPINDDCSFARYYITEDKYKELESFSVRAGDYLISCSGVTLGRITQVPASFEEGVINQALLRVRLNGNIVDDGYFIRMFRSPFFQSLIFANSTGSAIPNVKGVKELKAIPIPLPPLDEQLQIAKQIDESLSVVDNLSSSLDATSKRATRLRHSILKRAFQGKLVPQDPNDEPADKLLARIAAERQAAHERNGSAKKKRLRKRKAATKK